MPTPTLYTIGHSNWDLKGFLKLLRKHDIQAIVDVRTVPFSRYSPHFGEYALKRSLPNAEIEYVTEHHVALGGKTEQPRKRRLQSIHAVASIACKKRVAVMCSEGNFRDCHRYQILAPLFLESGCRVLHIQKDGKLFEDEPTMF